MSTDPLANSSARSEEQHRLDICRVGRWLYERGHIVAAEGNLSVRLDAERILTTPTCLNKGMMSPEDLVLMDLEGRHLQGHRQISSEAGMHLLFYRMRSDVQAVCHAHPATATGFAAAASLSVRERKVLHLRYVEDMTQTQIAEIIGVSQMQVSRILRRALAQLQELAGESAGRRR